MKSFYISYQEADLPWAKWIAWQLEQAGHSTILAAWDFRPGSNAVLELQQAIEKAERFLAVLSPDYLEKGKWAAAFARDGCPESGKLVPVRVAPCDLDGLWSSIVTIDLIGLDEQAAKTRLLAALDQTSARPSQSPPFPDFHNAQLNSPVFPGTSVPVWNIPRRNVNFTGRDELLEELRRNLTSSRPTALTQAISGLGGVGKTALAVEYSYRWASSYRCIWWIPSEEQPTLESALVELAQALGLLGRDLLDQRETLEKLRRWLETHDRWLLIFDNAEEPQDLEPYLPRSSPGHILITSRNSIWGRLAFATEVTVFDRSESIHFLSETTGRGTEDPTAMRLAEALGDLPLALEQAAFFIKSTQISFSEYLSMFRRFHTRLLERGIPEIEYPATVATTWEISFQKIQSVNKVAVEILKLFAFLAPETIPRKILLAETVNCLQQSSCLAQSDQLTLYNAIAELRKYSLITVHRHSYSIHRLVQSVIRDRLVRTASRWALAAAEVVDRVFVFDRDDLHTWDASAQLLPHALAISSFKDLDLANVVTGQLFGRVGLYLYERADYPESMELLHQSLRINEIVHGARHKKVASSLNDLAFAVQAEGDLGRSEEYFEKSLSILKAHYSGRHVALSTAHNNLGLVARARGYRKAGKKHLKESLAILRAACRSERSEDPSLATVLSNMSVDLGRNVRSSQYCEQALRIALECYGSQHPIVATLRNNAGVVALGQLQLGTTEHHFKAALVSDRRIYGDHHPTTAIRLNNLGILGVLRRDWSHAQNHLEDALGIDRKIYRSLNLNRARGYNNMGFLHYIADRPDAARPCFERALEICEALYVSRHPVYAVILNNLGVLLEADDELEESRSLLLRAYGIVLRAFGNQHPILATLLNNLGAVWEALGKAELARKSLERALGIESSNNDATEIGLVTILNNLGVVLEELGELELAQNQLERALKIIFKSEERLHANLGVTLTNLASVHMSLGNLERAKDLFRQALEADGSSVNYLCILTRLNNMGAVVCLSGDLETGQDYFRRALELAEQSSGEEHPVVETILKNMEKVLKVRGKIAEAQELRKRTPDIKQPLMPTRIAYWNDLGVVPVLAAMWRGGESSRGVALGDFAALGVVGKILSGTAAGGSGLTVEKLREERLPYEDIAAASRKEEFFKEIFERHYEPIVRWFVVKGIDNEAARDLAQSTFARVHQGLKRFRGEATFSTWILVIASNVLANHRRSYAAEKRNAELLSIDAQFEPDLQIDEWPGLGQEDKVLEWDLPDTRSTSQLEQLIDKERHTIVRETIETLSGRMKQCLLLHIEGYKYREIAEIMGIDLSTLKSILYAARSRLKHEIEETFPDLLE